MIVDLLIIGAGPVGLSTAVAALHRGAKRVIIAEQSRKLRPVGQMMSILPNGFRFLSALSPAMPALLEPYVNITPSEKVRGSTVSTAGRRLFDMHPGEYGKHASMAWWELQKLLIEALPNDGIVVLNHQLVDVVYEDGVVCAEFVVGRKRDNVFKNWAGDDDNPGIESVPEEKLDCSIFEAVLGTSVNGERRVRVKAKVIVGADGINSAVRRCMYRDYRPGWERYTDPIYSGFTRVGGWSGSDMEFDKDDERVLKEEYVRNSVLCFMTCEEDKINGSSPRGMIAHRGNGWFVGYFLAIDEATIKSSSDKELTDVALQKLRDAGFPEVLLRISEKIWERVGNIRNLKHYTVPATHPLPYERPDTMGDMEYPEDFERRWFYRRGVIIGDAAHAAPNFLAQGTSMGVEDGYLLVKLLGDSGMWRKGDDFIASEKELGDVFEKYRSERLERICYFQDRTIVRVSEYSEDGRVELLDKFYEYEI